MESSAQAGITPTADSLQNDLVKIGSIPEMRTVFDKPFPLVLEPRDGAVNFIQLQEYFWKNHEAV